MFQIALFDAFFEGIKIIPGAAVSGGHNALRLSFYEVQVYTYDGDISGGTALTIQPQGPQDISQVVFTNCAFEPSAMATMSSARAFTSMRAVRKHG